MFTNESLRFAFALLAAYSVPISKWEWFTLRGIDKTKWKRVVPGI